MSSNVKITYVNKSMNKDLPKIFLFLKNEIPTFDALKDGVVWKVIEDVGRESTCEFTFPLETEVGATWSKGTCKTKRLLYSTGRKYTVIKNEAGITIIPDGSAGNTRFIDVCNDVHVENGISVDLYKDGKIMITKKVVAYGQKATFILHPKLYWGVASEIQEGKELSSAVLDSDHFFEENLEGASNVTVALYGNATDGYQFKIENQE
ncbi:MAG: hypothetical protein Q8942_12265 [Bacillota bacterium]|nr:hypothetical protein [Bacillota bacterium]